MRTLRLLVASAAVAVAVGGSVGSGVVAAERTACGGTVSSAGNGWLASRPHFPAGPQRVTIAVAVPYLPNRIYVTNGASVLRTDDGGCNWQPTAVPAAPGQALLPQPLPQPIDGLLRIPSTLRITSLAAPSSATASEYLYVGGTNSSSLRDQPVVYAVRGGTTVLASSGLPDSGGITQVTASSAAPTTVYAVVSGGGALGAPGLYASTNGGGDWVQRAAPVDGLRELRANPVVQTSLFALGGNGVVRNNDGGMSSFATAGRPGGDVTSYDVVSGGGGARLVQGHSTRKAVDRSDDGGVSWTTTHTPVVAEQVALQPLLGQVAVSDGHRVFVQPAAAVPHNTHDVTPRTGAPAQLQFSAPAVAGYTLVGVSHGAVLRRTFRWDGSPLGSGDDLVPVTLQLRGPPHQFPSTLLPGSTSISLRPGAHRDVHYRLLLPRTPSPVDLMFLVDTTDSMAQTINGLRQDLATIVNDVASTGLDAQFGVAEFRDYAPRIGDMGAGDISDYPYKLRRVIGPDDASLQLALNKLKHDGGGDPPEADLTALFQSTTGAGQRYGKQVVIRPGLDAAYRNGSLRLAVLATDAPFHRERHYLTPQWGTTVAALRSHRVYPIGIAVQKLNDKNEPIGFPGLRNERELAVAAGSLAPAGGVDCNGDLVPDIAAGGPFVCTAPIRTTSTASVGGITVGEKTVPVKLAPAIVTAAESLPDVRTIGLGLTGASGIARLVAPATLPQVNLRNDNTLDYTVRFTCPRARQRHVYRLGLHASDGSRVLASADAGVVCDAVAPPPRQHHALPPAAVAVVPPAAAAAAPPAPGNPLPNPNPNPNPAPNANVGFASQEEEQRQLAFADADTGVDETTELAMSRPSSDAGAQLWFAGAAMLLMGAAGYAARSRLQVAWHTASAGSGSVGRGGGGRTSRR